MNYAAFLRDRRRLYGLTQVELAAKSRVSLPTVQNLETGKGNPSVEVLEKLGSTLGFHLKFEIQSPDWSLLAAHGLPLLQLETTDPGHREHRERLIREVLIALGWLAYHPEAHREGEALQAYLLAMRDHFGTFYRSNFAKSHSANRLLSLPMTGRVIKLRRLAITSLAEWL